uniref:TPR_REGION domain-containing protein n=1 Tax=Syphacia muris TaxID=451379 RepID=A0A0N5AAE5_9BILA
MWQEAIRIAKDYVPSSLHQIQEEYDEIQLRSGARGALSFIAQGEEWETQGDYQKALECYLKVNEALTDDVQTIATVLHRAGELVVKFFAPKGAREHGKVIVERLLQCNMPNDAAELSLQLNDYETAINAYIIAEDWTKAKNASFTLLFCRAS